MRRYRRRTYRRYPTRRKYRKYRSRRFRRRKARRPVLLIKKSIIFYRTTLSTSQSNPATHLNFNFGLNSIPGYTYYTGVFDAYKICFVKLIFQFNQQPVQVSTVGSNPAFNGLTCYAAVDYDEEAAFSDYTALASRNDCKQWDPTRQRSYSIVLRPKVSKMVYKSATSTGYSPGVAWIRTADPTVPHYGVLFSYAPVTPTSPVQEDHAIGTMVIRAIYYLALKYSK